MRKTSWMKEERANCLTMIPENTGILLFNSVFMAAISEVYLAIQEAGYKPYDQLIGTVRTENDQYITRRCNARKILAEMDHAVSEEIRPCICGKKVNDEEESIDG